MLVSATKCFEYFEDMKYYYLSTVCPGEHECHQIAPE
jgi:hypothetical protein